MRSIDGKWLKENELREIKETPNHTMHLERKSESFERERREEENAIWKAYVNNEKVIQDEASQFLDESFEAFSAYNQLGACSDEVFDAAKESVLSSLKIYQEEIAKYEEVINRDPIGEEVERPIDFYMESVRLYQKRLNVEELISSVMNKYGVSFDETTKSNKQL